MIGKDIIAVFLLAVVLAARTYPLYKQCDSRWANQQLGTSPTNTICKAGCLMSSAAMALSGTGSTQNPSTLNTWLKGHGGYVSDDLFVWASINSFGVAFSGFIKRAQVEENLNRGNIVILNVHNGGHWVLATSMLNSNTVAVNDPGYSTTSYGLTEVVQGNIGVYKVVNGFIGVMIHQLETILKISDKRKMKQTKVAILSQ